MNTFIQSIGRRLFICLVLIIILVSNIPAQNAIRFNHLTVRNGLSQSAVNCIFQDNKGFLWIGTQDGLNRFDGYNFKVFKNNPSDSTTIKENFILSIYEDAAGTLYCETRSGFFQKYNASNESFSVIPKGTLNVEKFKASSVLPSLIDRDGNHWIVSGGKGKGLLRHNPGSRDSTWFKHSASNPRSLSDDRVYSVYMDRSGVIWAGTYNGLDRFNPADGSFTHFRHNPNDPGSISDNWVWPILEDSRGTMWVGTVRGGLNRFDRSIGKFYTYQNELTKPNSLNSNFILSLFEDRGGVIWVGTSDAGLNSFHPASQYFEHFVHDPDRKNSLSDNSILSMIVDRKGNTWVGTRNNGFDRFDKKTGKSINYQNQPTNPNSVAGNAIPVMFEDHAGTIWLGTFTNGLDSFDPATGQFKHYKNDPKDPRSISDNRIYSIYEDKEHVLWVGTYGGGLNKFDRERGSFTNYKYNKNDSTTISSDGVWSLLEDRNGDLWVGTFGGGLNKFDRKKNIFQHFKHDDKNPNSISDDIIVSLFEDKNGTLWIGTSSGLNKFNRETGSFKYYREKDGLPNDVIFGVLEDKNGNLWISTNNGISRFNPIKETFRNYYADDGLQGNEFNQNAYTKNKFTGEIYFGGNNGFNIFQPEKVTDNPYIPPVVFSGFQRYNTDNKDGKAIVEKGISNGDIINLTYKDNIISFDVAALNYYNSSENQYKYKLEGFNENWIQMGNNHTIIFTNLSHGEYKLLVQGSNNDGIWNENAASLKLNITPPWWKTNIAYGLYLLVFFGMLYSARRIELKRREQKAQIRESALRIKATEAEKRALEIENERKTKELEEARQLQLSMLPKELPALPHLEIAAFMRTATEVGGDYYDFMVQENGVVNVAFGDATGHGLQAGTMVTLMKGFFTSDSSKLGLQEFMSHCSRVIKEIKLGRILMSFSYLKIDKNKITVTSAGMPPIYLYNKKTNVVEEIVIQGMPLGAMKNANYSIVEKELNAGDTILLLTDGLPEQMNNKEEMFDYSRVKQQFNEVIENSPEKIIEKLVEAGDEWMSGRLQDDDITFVVIRAK